MLMTEDDRNKHVLVRDKQVVIMYKWSHNIGKLASTNHELLVPLLLG